MFVTAGIIFYRTYSPRGGGVISTQFEQVPSTTPPGMISQPAFESVQKQPLESEQQQQSMELLENPFFADRVSVSGFKNLDQGVAQVVDDTQAMPASNVKAFNIGTGTDVLITWEEPNDPRIEDSAVYRSEYPSSLGSSVGSVKKGKQTYRDSTVKNGLMYYYTIGSRAQNIQEGLSESVSVRAEDTLPPADPQNVSVTVAQSRGVHIEWSASDDESVVLYRVYRSQTNGVLGDEIATVGIDKPLSYDDTLVVPGNSYYYAVIAVDVNGNNSAPRQLRPNIGNPYPFGR